MIKGWCEGSLVREGRKAGKQTKETDVPVPNERMVEWFPSVLSFVCFWGLINADVYRKSQSRISLHFSTYSDARRTDADRQTRNLNDTIVFDLYCVG